MFAAYLLHLVINELTETLPHKYIVYYHYRFGLITSEEKVCLDELFKYNPLLFDVASKRLVRGSGGEKFPVHAFKKHQLVLPAK